MAPCVISVHALDAQQSALETAGHLRVTCKAHLHYVQSHLFCLTRWVYAFKGFVVKCNVCVLSHNNAPKCTKTHCTTKHRWPATIGSEEKVKKDKNANVHKNTYKSWFSLWSLCNSGAVRYQPIHLKAFACTTKPQFTLWIAQECDMRLSAVRFEPIRLRSVFGVLT